MASMFDAACLMIGGLGMTASLSCLSLAVRWMDDIWHGRRMWVPRLLVAGLLLLAGAGAAFWCSPTLKLFFA